MKHLLFKSDLRLTGKIEVTMNLITFIGLVVLITIMGSCQIRNHGQRDPAWRERDPAWRERDPAWREPKTGFKVFDGNPVLKPGEKGQWDAGALGSMSVLKVGDLFHMYYEAWGVRSEKEWDAEEYESLQIGHATSKDGVHWTKDPQNPVLPRGAQGEWDRSGTWDPFVIYEDGLYKMWYGGGGGNKPCDWAYAISKDGTGFEKKGKLSNLGGVEDNHVVHDTDTGLYYMYYWDREYEPLALFCVTSPTETGFDFDKAVNIKIDGEKYPEMYKFTHVLKNQNGWHMFYADFERPHCPDSYTRYATSTDGIHWQARNKKLLEGHDAEVLKVADDLFLMYYGPRNHFDAKDCDIRLAVYNGRLGDLISSEGDILWQHTVGENIEATPAIDQNGNIYTTGGGYIWSFTGDGKLRWKTCPLDEGCKGLEQEYPYPLSVASSPAVSPDGKRVYITGYAGAFAFRTSDGKLLWKKTVFDNYYEFSKKNFEDQVKMWKESASKEYPKIFATTPAVSADGTRLYAGAGDNDFSSDSFYCIDTKDGSVVWEYVMPHPPQQIEEGKYTRGYLGGASIGPDGTVYIASMHGWLISLTDNGTSYTENWAYNVGAEMRMPPSMDAAGFLYVGSSSAGGYVHKVDSRTGKSAGGNWPVRTTAGEVFANISIGNDGTIFVNSEDHRLWAYNPDGTVKWNNLEFEHWGGDPLVRADGRIIVTSQLNKAARVVCIRDDGDKGVVEWFSEPITKELAYNETNANLAPNGDIYVTSGVESPHALFAIKGNGQGLSTTSPWPKYMRNPQNNGLCRSAK